MKRCILLAFTALVVSGASHATPRNSVAIREVVKNLDLTRFPNSVGPRRLSGKTTFADYGFVTVVEHGAGASLFQQDKSWVMRFRILSAGPHSLRLCFHDRGLARTGEAATPSYNATSALLVSKSPRGAWTARQVPAGFANCQNDPLAARERSRPGSRPSASER